MLRIVEPYSVVEIKYVAEVVGQGTAQVEAKYVSHFMTRDTVNRCDEPGVGCRR